LINGRFDKLPELAKKISPSPSPSTSSGDTSSIDSPSIGSPSTSSGDNSLAEFIEANTHLKNDWRG